MLSREENELVTRIGAGTPMGATMRRYWLPALLAWELPEPDCPKLPWVWPWLFEDDCPELPPNEAPRFDGSELPKVVTARAAEVAAPEIPEAAKPMPPNAAKITSIAAVATLARPRRLREARVGVLDASTRPTISSRNFGGGTGRPSRSRRSRRSVLLHLLKASRSNTFLPSPFAGAYMIVCRASISRGTNQALRATPAGKPGARAQHGRHSGY